jgi:hypothetical protein
MSLSKGGAPSAKEAAETSALGKLREGLPEVGHDCYKEWDTIALRLKVKRLKLCSRFSRMNSNQNNQLT